MFQSSEAHNRSVINTGRTNKSSKQTSNMTSHKSHLRSYMSRRPHRRGRSNKNSKKTKEDKNRVWLQGRDVTPLPLGLNMVGVEMDDNKNAISPKSSLLNKYNKNNKNINNNNNLYTSKQFVSLQQQQQQKMKKNILTQNNVPVNFLICETPTITLINIPSILVHGENIEECEKVKKENNIYDIMLHNKSANDKYIEQSTQTLNRSKRDKECEIIPINKVNIGVTASTSTMYDAYHIDKDAKTKVKDDFAYTIQTQNNNNNNNNIQHNNSPSKRLSTKLDTSGINRFMSSTSAGVSSQYISSEPAHHVPTNQTHTISTLVKKSDPLYNILDDNLLRNLSVMECAILQNNLHQNQSLYRDTKTGVDEMEFELALGINTIALDNFVSMNLNNNDTQENTTPNIDDNNNNNNNNNATNDDLNNKSKPHLSTLWSYKSQITDGLSVTCLDWNSNNTDLLAVGYGRLEFGQNTKGCLLIWSVKNPKNPENIMHLKHSVTSLSFCEDAPHLLAVGLQNGDVCTYDVRDKSGKPMMESFHVTGKHSDAVWQVKWIQDERNENNYYLITISTDGTVQQWSMKKGLIPHQLMQLKRIPNQAQFQKTNYIDGISRQAGGLCFDFPLNDTNQYLVGTEDGLIHKCSVSYNEQTLENYFGHTGSVNRLRCSPFLQHAFISCSADWTCALWTQKVSKPIMTFQSGQDIINDIQWSPANSCIFATAINNRVELWDIERSPLDPTISHNNPFDTSLISCISFNPKTPIIVAGSDDGTVNVYRIFGLSLNSENWTIEQQANRLSDAIYAHSSSEQLSTNTDQNLLNVQRRRRGHSRKNSRSSSRNM